MATGLSIDAMFDPNRILGVFSRVKKAANPLSRLLGFNIGGSNRRPYAGREFVYDVFNSTRTVAQGRGPGQSSAVIEPQLVGQVRGTFPRAAEKMLLTDEKIHNLRAIGGPAGELDKAGETYINRQQLYMGERFANVIEFQTAAMLRGGYTFVQSGDTLAHDFTGTGVSVDFRVPSGNKSQLNMLGAGNIISASWATNSTDIPTQLFGINNALLQLNGFSLAHICLTSSLWNSVVNNDYVQAQAGSSAAPAEISKEDDGTFTAVLKAMPWLTWHIIDNGLNIGTSNTYTKLISDTSFIGFPEPSAEWCEYLDGSEMVTEGPTGTRSEKFGAYAYGHPQHDPSGWAMYGGLNGCPSLIVPSAVVYGTMP